MVDRCFKVNFERLEQRALLSRVGAAMIAEFRPETEARGPALVGSIQGDEVYQANATGFQFQGTGSLQPMGAVTATGSFHPNKKTGAVNGHGTLAFSNAQGSVTLTFTSHGYFPLKKLREEELRVTAQVQSATGNDAGVRDKGTVNLVNEILPSHPGAPVPLPFNAQITLKPSK
jgi:hypothetical protein